VAARSQDRSGLPAPTAEGPLLAWLLDALRPMNRTRVKQLLRHGRVSVNGTTQTRHDFALQPGDQVAIAGGGPAITDRSLAQAGITIVFEDDALIAINKPAGLLSVATAAEKADTAFARLNSHLTARDLGRPFVVHRLDRETSGLLLFARSAAIRDQLQANWAEVTKTYLAVVEGVPRPAEGVIECYLREGRNMRVHVAKADERGRWSVSRYRVVAGRDGFSLVEVVLETGRKHQIRVHLARLDCPLIGDPMYGNASDPAGRLGLHAYRLNLKHPTTGQPLELESPLPVALRRVVG